MRTIRRMFRTVTLVLLLLAVSTKALPQSDPLIVKIEDGIRVEKLIADGGESEVLYTSDKWRIHSLTVSPNDERIAFIRGNKLRMQQQWTLYGPA